jgi:hypothetical protein
VLIAAEPSMDQMADTSLQDPPARRGPRLASDTNLQAKKYPEGRGT